MAKLTKEEEKLVDSISYYLRHPEELPDKNQDNGFSISDKEIDRIIKDALEGEF